MRRVLITAVAAAFSFTPACLAAQTAPAPAVAASVKHDLESALAGDWVGVLEYRDYSEPVTSTKREVLPTWLTITGQTWRITYDDGPAEVLLEIDTVHFDPEHDAYSESDDGKPEQTFRAAGYGGLKSGRGVLILTGSGTDNGKPSSDVSQ